MGKLEKFGRSILKKLGSTASSRRRRGGSPEANVASTSASTSSDDELTMTANQGFAFQHNFQVNKVEGMTLENQMTPSSEGRVASPAASDEGSAGYATDDTALSSLSPLDLKRVSVDYSESQGYYSNAELSPIPRILSDEVPAHHTEQRSPRGALSAEQKSPRISANTVPAHQTDRFIRSAQGGVDPTLPLNTEILTSQSASRQPHWEGRATVPTVPAPLKDTVAHLSVDPTIPLTPRITVDSAQPITTVPRTPLYKKQSQEYPRVALQNRLLKKQEPIYKSSQLLAEGYGSSGGGSENLERAATLSNLTSAALGIDDDDPIEKFMRSHIYKTKMITTVFEANDSGFEEITLDVMNEIDRWFESKNMMAVACELHWSVPRGKRSRKLECKLKEKLLHALRENNKRLLYLRGMGHGTTPVKLAESKTVENISSDSVTDSVRGIYQRSYTRLLPYLHKETPEWHSQYWTLQDIQDSEDDDVTTSSAFQTNRRQMFMFDAEPADVLSRNSLISLNIIGLSILGNSRKSCGSLFLQ